MASQKNIIALDVGIRSARILWMTMHGDTPVVTRTESLALPADEEDPHRLISTWIDSLGLSKHFCAVSLPGTQAVFQSGRVMPNDPRTAEEVARMDIEQFSEMAGDEMVHDVFAFEPSAEPNVKRYIMSMARPAAIQDAIQSAKLNHIRPADLVAAPVALFNAVEHWSYPHEQPWCYVNIGHSQTELAIGLKDGLLFARAIPVGGKLFTDAVMQATGLPIAQAEVRKHGDCGLRAGDACFEALRAAADRWISQYVACTGVYRSQFQDRKLAVEMLVIAGGTTLLKGFKEYLQLNLGIPVVLASDIRDGIVTATPVLRQETPKAPDAPRPAGISLSGRAPIKIPGLSKTPADTPAASDEPVMAPTPAKTVEVPRNDPYAPPQPQPQRVSDSLPPGFEVAYGLALTALQRGVAYLSLLPSDLKDEVVFRQKKPWWIASAVFVLGAMAIYTATGLILIHRDKELLDKEQQKLNKLEQIDRQIQMTRQQCQQIVTNTVPLDDLLLNGPLARDVLSLVASTVDPNDWITLFCDEKIYNPEEQELEENERKEAAAPRRNTYSLFRSMRTGNRRPNPAAPTRSAADEKPKKKEMTDPLSSIFIVEGYTPEPSLKSVKEMIERLKTAPEVKRVDLRSDDKVLKPTGIPEFENEKLPSFRRFVIEIEVNRP